MRRRAIAVLVIGTAGAFSAGCGGGHRGTARAFASGRFSVPLIEYRHQKAVAALVGLTLEGHLYYFLVDTGAARTIIDRGVAEKLGLRDEGSPREAAPLGCKVSAQPVSLRSWRLGDMALPASTVFTHRLVVSRAFPGIPFGGLLGSDFLSRFGTVTIDFTHRHLILGGKTPTRDRAVPIKVLRRADSVLATTQVTFDNHRAQFLIDSGAAISLIDSATAAQLRLPVVGPSTTVTGAVCRSSISPVQVREWTIARVRLPKAVIGRARDLLPQRYRNEGVVGIIGTSTLARLGTVTIDYRHAAMMLGSPGR